MRRRLVWRSLALTLAAAAALATVAAAADSRKPRTDAGRAGVGGMQVAIDPETGRLRQPTPEEARELAAGLAKLMAAAPKSEVSYHADGAVSLVLGADSLSFAVARLDADAGVAHACVDDPAQALAFLQATSTAAAEEK